MIDMRLLECVFQAEFAPNQFCSASSGFVTGDSADWDEDMNEEYVWIIKAKVAVQRITNYS